ncbi:hypothetical protein V8E54_007026 [Elaphomyces granulatus]
MELDADTKKIRGACYNCGKTGHRQKDCWHKKKDWKNSYPNQSQKSNLRKDEKLQAQKLKMKETRPEQKKEELKAEISAAEYLRATEHEEIACTTSHSKGRSKKKIPDGLPEDLREIVEKYLWARESVEDTDRTETEIGKDEEDYNFENETTKPASR